MRPVIGVTSSYAPPKDNKFGSVSISESYLQAVMQAGGIPVVIPVGLPEEDLQAAFARVDGLLLTGGGDIDPSRFNGPSHPRIYDIDPARDTLEIGLARLAAERSKPFMGICRGIQVMNVALGGTLYTDITDQLDGALRHDYYPNIPRDMLAHSISVIAGSRLAKILGGRETLTVNSLHHQGIQQVAAGLRIAAHAPDGLVEAVELPGHPFGLGVQWHPEWLQEHAPHRALFRALIRAAAPDKTDHTANERSVQPAQRAGDD